MKSRFFCVFVAISDLLLAAEVSGTVRNVPGDYPTIQQAVNQSYFGDVVVVAPGVYTEMVNLHDDHLPSILSTRPDDPDTVATTVLYGGVTVSSAFYALGTLRISGLTILGDGVYLGWLSPEGTLIVSNNVISFGYAGVFVDVYNEAEVRIINNEITDTTCGILSQAGAASTSFILNNRLAWNDLGIYGSIADASHNDIRYSFLAGARLEGEGAFHGNHVGENFGAGVEIFGDQPYLVHNNFIVANRDGLLLGEHTAAVSNTIAGNTGVGVAFSGHGLDSVRDCIIYANGTAVTDPLGTPNVTWTCSSTPLAGDGNFVADPLFAGVAAGDYHLTDTSPCINRGDPDYDWSPAVFDHDGDLRVIGGRLDVGADETPVVAPPTPGDMNGDGTLDGLDIQMFVEALLSR